MTNGTVSADARYDFLDWLRVLAIFALFFYHTGMIFVGWGWHIENAETIDWLQRPMDIAHRLRMPLLFVISGAGLWFALRGRTGGQVVRERSLRLALPVIAGMLLIVPPQIYFERLANGHWQGGYASFMVERVFQFQPYPKGDFSWHHLWFVVYLYVYVLLLLPLLLWWRRKATTLRPGAWLLALSLPLAFNEAVLKPIFPESHNLVSDWYVFNHYLLLTVYGFLLASMEGVWDWLAAQRRKTLLASIAMIAIALPLFTIGVIQRDTPVDALIANVFTWTTLLAFLGYSRAHLSLDNGFIRWARDASYPIYILHQTIIVALAYYLVPMPWSAGAKYWVVLIGALIACILLYESIVRRLAVTRLLFGMKARAPFDVTTTNLVSSRRLTADQK